MPLALGGGKNFSNSDMFLEPLSHTRLVMGMIFSSSLIPGILGASDRSLWNRGDPVLRPSP